MFRNKQLLITMMEFQKFDVTYWITNTYIIHLLVIELYLVGRYLSSRKF